MAISKKLSSVAVVVPLMFGSLLMGAGTANATTCPAGTHWNEMGAGVGFCSPDASGGGTGGDVIIDLGGQPNSPDPVAPEFPAPAPYVPPLIGVAPVAPVIAQPAPAPAPAPQQVAPVAPRAVTSPVAPATSSGRVPEKSAAVPVAPVAPKADDAAVESKATNALEPSPVATPSDSTSPSSTPESSAPPSLSTMETQEASSTESGTDKNVSPVLPLLVVGGALVLIGGATVALMVRKLKTATRK